MNDMNYNYNYNYMNLYTPIIKDNKLVSYDKSPLCSRALFVPYGYRTKNTTFLDDLFIFHNETLNIWSHLYGSLLFGYLGYINLFSGTSYFPSIYCFTVCFALVASTFYHICCSKTNLYKNAFALDLIGMFSVIIITVNSCMYRIILYANQYSFGFNWYYIHSTFFGFLSINTLYYTVNLVLRDTPESTKMKILPMHSIKVALTVLGCMGYGLIPCIHVACAINLNIGWSCFQQYYLIWLSWLSGFIIWKLQIPERWNPNLFCMRLNSHTIHHMMICINAFWHYKILLTPVPLK